MNFTLRLSGTSLTTPAKPNSLAHGESIVRVAVVVSLTPQHSQKSCQSMAVETPQLSYSLTIRPIGDAAKWLSNLKFMGFYGKSQNE
jgi:hypothetical protein